MLYRIFFKVELSSLKELLKPVQDYLKIVRATKTRADRRIIRAGIVACQESDDLSSVLTQLAGKQLHRVWALSEEGRACGCVLV